MGICFVERLIAANLQREQGFKRLEGSAVLRYLVR